MKTIAIVWFIVWVVTAMKDVGEPRPCSGGNYTWELVLCVAALLAVSTVSSYLAGRKDERNGKDWWD